MKELAVSASSYHKSRAGTTYSIVNRLLANGLLQRNSANLHLIEITPTGTHELLKWLAPPLPAADISHSADLLRLRCFFLGALPAEQRKIFLAEAHTALHAFLAEAEELLSQSQARNDYFCLLAITNVVMETQSRLRWLKLVTELLENPLPEDICWKEAILNRIC